jgi:hypothetical protein
MHLFTRLTPILCLFCAQLTMAQTNSTDTKIKKKGTLYISWGYNREKYSKSDIRFKNTKSDNYDFVMQDAKAHEKPGFNKGMKEFLNTDLTIPQYNLHIGYLFNDKHNLGIELSWDHLKYIVNDDVTVHLKGQIRGNQIDKDTFVNYDFIHLQHTNGNNYLMLNLVKQHQLYKDKYLEILAIGKVGAGPLVSYSISNIMGSFNDDKFRIQGFVLGVNAGIRYNVFKYVFIQPAFQYAFADYTNTPIGADGKGRVTHVFSSYMISVEAGFNIPIGTVVQ